MARPVHTESSRRGVLVAALVIIFILSFMPQRVVAWLTGPRRIVQYLLLPVSDPARSIAVWFFPAAPKPNDPLVAHYQSEVEKFKKLLLDAQRTIEEKQKLIDSLQKGAANSEEVIRQYPAPVVGVKSSGTGGMFELRAGKSAGVELNTIASVGGLQLVGRVSDAGSRTSWVTLITDPKAGAIDGAIFADDGTRGALIRNIRPVKGKRYLQGLVQYSTPAPTPPKVNDVVRVDDPSNWPRSAQRLIIGRITEVQTVAGGRVVVTVNPTAELERLGEVVLLITPKADAGGGGGP